jgi:hypothetical protein
MSALEVFNNNTVSVSGVSFREEEGRLIHMAVVCVRVGDEGPKATMVWSVDTVTGESIRRVNMDATDTSDHRFTRWLVELSITMDMVWEGLEELLKEAQLMRTTTSLDQVNKWAKQVTFDWDVFDEV